MKRAYKFFRQNEIFKLRVTHVANKPDNFKHLKKILIALILIVFCFQSKATEPLKDYSFIRGVCYPNGWMNKPEIIRRDLGYARRLNINSTRIWLGYRRYSTNPEDFINHLKTYVRIADSMGISTMPVLWNGSIVDSTTSKDDFHKSGDKYIKAVVEALKNEKGLLMWDIMNEPSYNAYYRLAPEEKKQDRWNDIDNFVRYYCKLVKKLDPKNAITIGHTFPKDLKMGADLVDVLCFHDYLGTRKQIEHSYSVAEDFSKKYNKPVVNSETGCIGRANPYDLALEICDEHKAGWYVFQLMISGYWSKIHGIFYPDGTIRDPSIVAAIMGFFRNRDIKTRIKPDPNQEGNAEKGIKMVEDALKQDSRTFRNRQSSTDQILEAAEYCANLLESAEMVPMINPPSVKIRAWQAMDEQDRDVAAIKDFAYHLALQLKKDCLLF